MTPYQLGQQAYNDNKKRSENPYLKYGVNWNQWNDGWDNQEQVQTAGY